VGRGEIQPKLTVLRMKKSLFIVAFLVVSMVGFCQNKTYLEYIETYQQIAVREMNSYRIPASITLAQGLLESAAGKSRLAVEANNHFGVKCRKDWTGPAIYHDDDAKGECFRKYNDALESYEDHSRFLVNSPRYAFLFDFEVTDYKSWAFGLKKAGYATDPNYPTRLIKIIEDYKLNAYDSAATITPKEKPQIEDKQVSSQPPVTNNKPKNKKSFFSKLVGSEKPTTEKDTNQEKVFSDGTYIADISPFRTHEVQKINGVKCVIAQFGDTYASIAEEFGMFEKELLRANEVKYGTVLKADDIVFLAKKKKSANSETYLFREGDTMYGVSQLKGIKVRSLYRINGLIYGKEPQVGTVIKLKK
jgi:LysM repeat protein